MPCHLTLTCVVALVNSIGFGERQGKASPLIDDQDRGLLGDMNKHVLSKTLCPERVFDPDLSSDWQRTFDHFYVCTAGKEERLDHMKDLFVRLKVPEHKQSIVRAFNFNEWGTEIFRRNIKKAFGVRNAGDVFWTENSGVPPSLVPGTDGGEEVVQGKWVSGFEPLRIAKCQDATAHNTMDFKETMNKCGGIGCTLVHMAAMQKIAQSRDKIALIMEDDVCPSANFNSLVMDAVNNLPKDFDIVKLEDCGRKEIRGLAEITFGQHNSWSLIKHPAASYCTAAYAVSKKGAMKYMKLYSRVTYTNCDDQLLAFMNFKNVNGYILKQNLFAQYKTYLGISKSDITDALSEGDELAEAAKVKQVLSRYSSTTFPSITKEVGRKWIAVDRKMGKANRRGTPKTSSTSLKLFFTRAENPKPIIGNALCNIYGLKDSPLDAFTCIHANDVKKCAKRCHEQHSTGRLCTSFTFHPNSLTADGGMTCASMLTMTGGSKTTKWGGQCCLVHDDMFVPNIPMPDEVDEMNKNPSAVRTQSMLIWDDANAQALYSLYGNTWVLARAQCQSHGKDLCSTKQLPNAKAWTPVLDVCNAFSRDSKKSWVPKKSILETAYPYWKDFLTNRGINMQLSCCASSAPWTPHRHQTKIETIVTDLKDIGRFMKQTTINLLRIVINHSQAGFFAAVSWVLSQLLLAEKYSLIPFVDWGPCVLRGFQPGGQQFRYFDSIHGGNAWTTFFEEVVDVPQQLRKHPLGKQAHSIWDIPVNVLTLHPTQVWDVRTAKEYACEQYAQICGTFDLKLQSWYAKQRKHAFSVMQYIRPRKTIRQKVQAFWERNTKGITHIISAHVRGTDKNPEIGGYKILPEKFFPLIDTYLQQYQHSKLFVATDSPSYLFAMQKKYGKKMFYYDGQDALRTEENSFLDASTYSKNYAKGEAVLIDSLCLSRGNALLGGNSAVSEFAVYFNKKLVDLSFNLNFLIPPDLVKSQSVFKPEFHSVLTSFIAPRGPACEDEGEGEDSEEE